MQFVEDTFRELCGEFGILIKTCKIKTFVIYVYRGRAD